VKREPPLGWKKHSKQRAKELKAYRNRQRRQNKKVVGFLVLLTDEQKKLLLSFDGNDSLGPSPGSRDGGGDEGFECGPRNPRSKLKPLSPRPLPSDSGT
jgi:hypothetical protein